MPHATLLTIAHLEGEMLFGRMFMTEVKEVGVLWFGHLLQHLLFLACYLLYTGVEFIFSRVLHIRVTKEEPLLAGEPQLVRLFRSLGGDFLVAIAKRVVLSPGGK